MATKEVFLSYKEEDGDLAGNVKEYFERLGWEVFLAHEDIRPTEEWRAEILEHLDTCSALVTIVTPDFRNSEWTNQEVGIAIGKGKPIVSLIFNGTNNLPGFLESFQGIRVFPDELEKAVAEAHESIADKGSSTANATYIRLAASMRKLVNRWESYRNVIETIGRSAEAIKNLQRSYRAISDELLDLISTKESEIESGVVHQARALLNLMQIASFMDIGSLPDVFDDQIREAEKPAEAAYRAAEALVKYLTDTKKIK